MARSLTMYADKRRPVSKRAVGPLLCVLVLFYLAFHAVSGDRGLFALFKESRRLELVKTELAMVKADRVLLDAKVQALSSNSLDLDLLDEQARIILGMAGKNEVVYFTDTAVK